jgi:hypothetical protein
VTVFPRLSVTAAGKPLESTDIVALATLGAVLLAAARISRAIFNFVSTGAAFAADVAVYRRLVVAVGLPEVSRVPSTLSVSEPSLTAATARTGSVGEFMPARIMLAEFAPLNAPLVPVTPSSQVPKTVAAELPTIPAN